MAGRKLKAQRKIVILAALPISVTALLLSSNTSFSQDRNSLPQGYYIFLGTKPGQDPTKSFTVDVQGIVRWREEAVAAPTATAKSSSQELSSPQPIVQQTFQEATINSPQWETRSYPFISWKAHPITTIPGGIAKLTTTLARVPNTFDLRLSGTLDIRYKLTLFKVPKPPYSLEVQLLDSNGFKIKSFIVSGESFHPVPGSESLFEAAGEAFCATDDEYKNACDYLIRNTNRLF